MYYDFLGFSNAIICAFEQVGRARAIRPHWMSYVVSPVLEFTSLPDAYIIETAK